MHRPGTVSTSAALTDIRMSCRAPGETRLNYTVEVSPHGGKLPKQLVARLHTGVRHIACPRYRKCMMLPQIHWHWVLQTRTGAANTASDNPAAEKPVAEPDQSFNRLVTDVPLSAPAVVLQPAGEGHGVPDGSGQCDVRRGGRAQPGRRQAHRGASLQKNFLIDPWCVSLPAAAAPCSKATACIYSWRLVT